MGTDEQLPAKYRFDDPVNVLATLDRLGIEHLEVSNERTIIYDQAIINCEVPAGQLHDARIVSVEIFDPPLNTNADEVRLPIERLIETIATTAAVDWDQINDDPREYQ